MSAFVEQTLVNAVDISLFAILLPVFIIGGLLGGRVHGFKRDNKEVIKNPSCLGFSWGLYYTAIWGLQ